MSTDVRAEFLRKDRNREMKCLSMRQIHRRFLLMVASLLVVSLIQGNAANAYVDWTFPQYQIGYAYTNTNFLNGSSDILQWGGFNQLNGISGSSLCRAGGGLPLHFIHINPKQLYVAANFGGDVAQYWWIGPGDQSSLHEDGNRSWNAAADDQASEDLENDYNGVIAGRSLTITFYYVLGDQNCTVYSGQLSTVIQS
jgi:hypothetical protein